MRAASPGLLIATCRVAAEHFVAELVNQHAYGWLEVVAAPVLVDGAVLVSGVDP